MITCSKITIRQVLAAIGVAVAFQFPLGSQAVGAPASVSLETVRKAAARIKPLHRPKEKPNPGDWLAKHPEPGQTFEQYRASKPNRPSAVRTTLYMQPIGDLDETRQRVIADTAEFMSRRFGLLVKQLPSLPLDQIPPYAQRVHPTWGDHQLLSTYILDKVLKPRRPANAVAMLGLTTTDLWPGEGWNFVFGQASLEERIGVWSLYRYGNPNEGEAALQQFRRRTFKVAVHETGHMFGMLHCTAYECLMNGSNNLTEMDRRPMWFCPECVQKVWWACAIEPVGYYQSLVDFADKHQLAEDRQFWNDSLERVKR